MKAILDTCAFIWLCSEPEKLSSTAGSIISDDESSLILSDVSVMEITMKWAAGKLQLPDPPRLWVEKQLNVWNIESSGIDREDMYRASELPSFHKDPFDRLLAATSLRHDAVLLTPDPQLRKYPISTRW